MKNTHYLNCASEVLHNSTKASITQDNSFVNRISTGHRTDEGPQRTLTYIIWPAGPSDKDFLHIYLSIYIQRQSVWTEHVGPLMNRAEKLMLGLWRK